MKKANEKLRGKLARANEKLIRARRKAKLKLDERGTDRISWPLFLFMEAVRRVPRCKFFTWVNNKPLFPPYWAYV